MKLILEDVSLGTTASSLMITHDKNGLKILEQAQADAAAEFFASVARQLSMRERGEPGQLSLAGGKK